MKLDLLKLWMERHHQRMELSELDSHLLKDIGVGRHQAEKEASKWFWQS